MSAAVEIQGEAEVRKMLGQWMDPLLNKRAQRAAKSGANVLKGPLKAEAAKVSKRMASSVYVHVAKRDKPAYIVGHKRKKAFFWHMVVGGTRDHGPRKAGNKFLVFKGRSGGTLMVPRVRGVKANPMVARVATQYSGRAYDAMVADLGKEA